MRRSLTTLAAIAALTALPTTAHATDHRPDTVPNPPVDILLPQDEVRAQSVTRSQLRPGDLVFQSYQVNLMVTFELED
jgi:hypothetical protein